MIRKGIKRIILCTLAAIPMVSVAQEPTIDLNLEKAIEIALAENPTIRVADKEIELTDLDFTSNYAPFVLFKNSAITVMKQANIPEEHYRNNIVAMWAMVHGLAAMANMKSFKFNGDWKELTETILFEKLTIG